MLRNQPTLPHLGVMFSQNCVGMSVPLFLIIPDIENCPFEVKPFIKSGLIWACSTPSGWQTRNSIVFWGLNFINGLSNYRLTLDPSFRDKKAVLIVDGHNSRENPVAIRALKENNVEVIVLPSHTTHLLQMFDVVLASPFKQSFSNRFSKIFRNEYLNATDEAFASIIRTCVIETLLKSWSETCTIQNCMTAEKKKNRNFSFNPNVIFYS